MNMVGLNRGVSDHNPLLLMLEVYTNWGPKPFRCYDAWFLNPQFKCSLVSEWRNIPNVPLHNKLKILKVPLKTWRKENFDLMDNKISELEAVIHELENKSDVRMLNNMESARLKAANSLLHQWLVRRERVWRQRARTYGFNIKYHNTKFFHASTMFKRRKNEMVQIKINGRRVQGVANLKSEIRNYFVQRFAQEQQPVFDFDLGNHPKISEDQAVSLETIPSREEVKRAVWACGIDKASGFDCFNFKFIRDIWEVIEDELFEYVMEFFIQGRTVRRHLGLLEPKG